MIGIRWGRRGENGNGGRGEGRGRKGESKKSTIRSPSLSLPLSLNHIQQYSFLHLGKEEQNRMMS